MLDGCNSFVWSNKSLRCQIRSREIYQTITQLLQCSGLLFKGQVTSKMLNMALFTGLNPYSVSLFSTTSASSACSLYLSLWFPFPLMPCPLHLSSPKYLPLILVISIKMCPSFIIHLQIDYSNNTTVDILRTFLTHRDICFIAWFLSSFCPLC